MVFYSIGEYLSNGISYLYTKMIWGKAARLIRLPFHARNRKNIYITAGFTTGYCCRVTAGKQESVNIGKHFVMGDFCQIEGQGGIKIGSNVLMGSRVFIGTTSHGNYSDDSSEQSSPNIPPNEREVCMEKIEIGDNVWIGNGVSVLKGVNIKKGSVIGANSVVVKDIPEYSIAVGAPAKVVKRYQFDTKLWENI
ncbi:MAG: DapH/DapD/GlmU-related protein [Lachnospiraceae bacterium]